MSEEFNGFKFYNEEHENRFSVEKFMALVQIELVDPNEKIPEYMAIAKDVKTEEELYNFIAMIWEEVYDIAERETTAQDIIDKINYLRNTQVEISLDEQDEDEEYEDD